MQRSVRFLGAFQKGRHTGLQWAASSSSASALTQHRPRAFATPAAYEIQREKVQSSAQVRNSKARGPFEFQLSKATTVVEMLDAWEQYHVDLILADKLLVLEKLVEVKLNNYQQLRAKMEPTDQNPNRDPRLAALLEGIQVRVANRDNLLGTFTENAQLCRGVAFFRFEVESFWAEMSIVLLDLLKSMQGGPAPAAQDMADIAWAFGRMKVMGTESSLMFERMGTFAVHSEADIDNDQMYTILWAMQECNVVHSPLDKLYEARMDALEDDAVNAKLEHEISPEERAQYTDLYDALRKDVNMTSEEDPMYASDDPEEDAILAKDTLPEWVLRLQAHQRPRAIHNDSPVELYSAYRDAADALYTGPNMSYSELSEEHKAIFEDQGYETKSVPDMTRAEKLKHLAAFGDMQSGPRNKSFNEEANLDLEQPDQVWEKQEKHEFDEDGVCKHCSNTRAELESLEDLSPEDQKMQLAQWDLQAQFEADQITLEQFAEAVMLMDGSVDHAALSDHERAILLAEHEGMLELHLEQAGVVEARTLDEKIGAISLPAPGSEAAQKLSETKASMEEVYETQPSLDCELGDKYLYVLSQHEDSPELTRLAVQLHEAGESQLHSDANFASYFDLDHSKGKRSTLGPKDIEVLDQENDCVFHEPRSDEADEWSDPEEPVHRVN